MLPRTTSLYMVCIVLRSSSTMDCMLLTFEHKVQLIRKAASVVWHHTLLLMNSFNKNQAAIYSMQTTFSFSLMTSLLVRPRTCLLLLLERKQCFSLVVFVLFIYLIYFLTKYIMETTKCKKITPHF